MTDTGGMNAQINDTPISQENAIGSGVCGWWGRGGVFMLRLACLSGHLHNELHKRIFFHSTLYSLRNDLPKPNALAPLPQSSCTPRINNNKVSSPLGARPPMVRHLLLGMVEALLIQERKPGNFIQRCALAMQSEGVRVCFSISRRSLTTSSWREPEVS